MGMWKLGNDHRAWAGRVGEVLIYNKYLALDELSVVVQHLGTKWGFTIP